MLTGYTGFLTTSAAVVHRAQLSLDDDRVFSSSSLSSALFHPQGSYNNMTSWALPKQLTPVQQGRQGGTPGRTGGAASPGGAGAAAAAAAVDVEATPDKPVTAGGVGAAAAAAAAAIPLPQPIM
jgi:hypothetical protein